MSTLHNYCALHIRPEMPYHTPERWWIKLINTNTRCDICGGQAVWLELRYAVRQDAQEA